MEWKPRRSSWGGRETGGENGGRVTFPLIYVFQKREEQLTGEEDLTPMWVLNAPGIKLFLFSGARIHRVWYKVSNNRRNAEHFMMMLGCNLNIRDLWDPSKGLWSSMHFPKENKFRWRRRICQSFGNVSSAVNRREVGRNFSSGSRGDGGGRKKQEEWWGKKTE